VPIDDAARRLLARLRRADHTELHVHLEGSISAPTLVALAGRSPEPIFPSLHHVRERQAAGGDFRRFLSFYRDVCRCLKSPADYAAAAQDLCLRLSRERIRHAEVYLSPAVVEKMGLPWVPVRDAIEAVFAAHERRRRGRIRVLLDSVRQWGPAAAMRVLDLHARHPWSRAVGFGLGGDERSVPARDYARVYARVRSLGLAPLVHAGEWAGPESVAAALRWLAPVRIAHGLRAAEDPALMRALAARGVPLDACPTSNVATGALPSLADAAARIRTLLAGGVAVTLSTDDPGLFASTLHGEYRRLAEAGLGAGELAAIFAFSRRSALTPRERARRP